MHDDMHDVGWCPSNWKEIGDHIKSLEAQVDNVVPSEECFLVRLDGCNFRTFTKGMDRPFDLRFAEAMIKTTEDLLTKFNCRTGFTQSDEITLFFSNCDVEKGQTHLYGGRVQKLCSILAAYTSVRFNANMKKHEWNSVLQGKLEQGAIFDARIIIPDNEHDVVNCFLWRHIFECSRNAIMAIAQHHFSAKELHGIKCQEALEMLSAKGIHLRDFPDYCVYGTYVKKILEEKMGKNPKTGAEEPCVKTVTRRRSVAYAVTLEYVIEKYDII